MLKRPAAAGVVPSLSRTPAKAKVLNPANGDLTEYKSQTVEAERADTQPLSQPLEATLERILDAAEEDGPKENESKFQALFEDADDSEFACPGENDGDGGVQEPVRKRRRRQSPEPQKKASALAAPRRLRRDPLDEELAKVSRLAAMPSQLSTQDCAPAVEAAARFAVENPGKNWSHELTAEWVRANLPEKSGATTLHGRARPRQQQLQFLRLTRRGPQKTPLPPALRLRVLRGQCLQ